MNPLTVAQENQLVKEAQRGNRDAFAQLVQAVESRVYRVALQILRQQEDAEDALQDGLLKAYEKLGTFSGLSRFSTWVTRIVINECLMRLRSRNGHSFSSIDEPLNDEGDLVVEPRAWEENPEERYSRTHLREILNEALSGLSEEYRVVVLLRDVEGFTNEEAAQELGITVSAVKSRLLRGRLALRQRLSRYFLRKSRASAKSSLSMENVFTSLMPLATVAVAE